MSRDNTNFYNSYLATENIDWISLMRGHAGLPTTASERFAAMVLESCIGYPSETFMRMGRRKHKSDATHPTEF